LFFQEQKQLIKKIENPFDTGENRLKKASQPHEFFHSKVKQPLCRSESEGALLFTFPCKWKEIWANLPLKAQTPQNPQRSNCSISPVSWSGIMYPSTSP